LTHNASIMWMNQGLLRFRRNPCGFVWVWNVVCHVKGRT
jgi:hypothetical protein